MCHSRQPTPTSLEDLIGATFSALRQATFKKAANRLSGHATFKYNHYMGQSIQTRQPNIFICTSKSSDKDMANDPDGAKYWWQAECKEVVAKNRGYITSLCKMFLTVLGSRDNDLQGKVRNWVDFDSLKSSGNTLGLINAIDQKGYGLQSAKYASFTYHQAQVKFRRLIQGQGGRNYTMSDHLEHHSYMVDLTERAGGKLDGFPA